MFKIITKIANNTLSPRISSNAYKKSLSYCERLKYTIDHKKAYLQVEKKLLGKNTIAGYQDEMTESLKITDFDCDADTVTAYVFGDIAPLIDLTYKIMIIE